VPDLFKLGHHRKTEDGKGRHLSSVFGIGGFNFYILNGWAIKWIQPASEEGYLARWQAIQHLKPLSGVSGTNFGTLSEVCSRPCKLTGSRSADIA
jgi:hypothetical protein